MWQPFLSNKRIGGSKPATRGTEVSRSEFHKDYDRIIFSSAFRRLSDKTQVVPFPKSDYTRQRLTHSLEVSCVGRSLATSVYEMVRNDIGDLASQGDFEAIVAAACLAHDIGNPPFGHFGEKAIQDWAVVATKRPELREMSSAERSDLTLYEGNAQSFRILTRLQMSNRRGGMRLTAATLGAMIKYPRPSNAPSTIFKKHGFFQDDAELFSEVFETAGRLIDQHGQYARHPLAWLSEAADDICYAIIDLEDGCNAGLIPAEQALDILEGINAGSTGSRDMPESDRLSMGRALAINALVNQSAEIFQTSLSSILDGSFRGSLMKRIPSADPYDRAKKTAYDKVFNSELVLQQEASGYRAIQGLLDILTTAALTTSPSSFDSHVRKLTRLRIDDELSVYQKVLACTDKVSGMTDRYSIDLYKKLSGHAFG